MQYTIKNKIWAKKLKAKNYKLKAAAGFTLVEVLIALAIFSIAITGVITVAAQGGTNISVARDKITATYLADEGIELMRAMRDTAVVDAGVGFEDIGWAAFTSSSYASLCTVSSCDIDSTDYSGSSSIPFPNSSNVIGCAPTGGFCPLKYNPTSGYYSAVAPAGLPSLFSRAIIISVISADEVKVTSTVHWKEGTVVQSVTQSENLYNWYN